MPDPEVLPKSVSEQVKAQSAQIKELERTIKALLVAAKEWNDCTGRECMPEGEYYGEKF